VECGSLAGDGRGKGELTDGIDGGARQLGGL